MLRTTGDVLEEFRLRGISVAAWARHHAMQMYAATGGSPAYVMSFVKEAVLHALKVGSDRLSMEDFEQAWESGLCLQASLVRKNPFRMTQTELASSLREVL